jgi:anti-sigma factor RsiW
VSDHLGDDAALYALGLLDDPELAQLEGHLERCDACRRLVAQFESDVAEAAAAQPQLAAPPQLLKQLNAIVQGTPVRTIPRKVPSYLAVAAAFLIALLPSAYLYEQNQRMDVAMSMDNEMMGRLASPHRIAAFEGSGPEAHVMYGRDGTWYVVVVKHAAGPVRVMWSHDGVETDLGQVQPRGDVAILYLPRSRPMRQLALASGGQVVSQAQLVF